MTEMLHSKIWEDEAEPGNSFAAAAYYCSGHDVYRELLTQAIYFDLYLRLTPLQFTTSTLR